MFTIIQEFTEKYCGFRGSLFSIHPLSGYERLQSHRGKSNKLSPEMSVTVSEGTTFSAMWGPGWNLWVSMKRSTFESPLIFSRESA